MTKAFIVGAGPGDPELLTLAAVKVLKAADVVLFDRLVTSDILSLANPSARLIDVGKQAGEQQRKQKKIFEHFQEFAGSEKVVVRLKGGDPYIFGRGFEEYVYLSDLGYDVKVIPGVSSVIAAPALAGIPLTARGYSRGFAVVTGSCCSQCGVDWHKYSAVDTLVILMAVEQRQSIARALIDCGRPADEPIAFVENASCADQRVIRSDLRSVANGLVDVKGPAVFVVGEVTALADDERLSYEEYAFESSRARLQIA